MAKNDFRVTSIFKIIIRICMKNVEFCGKTSKFLPKKCPCLFIFCIFYLNEKELHQQVCLIKYAENKISNSTSHKKKRERSKNIPTSKASILRLLKIFTNFHKFPHFHKLSLLQLVVKPWQKFEKQKLILNFESCYCYFK